VAAAEVISLKTWLESKETAVSPRPSEHGQNVNIKESINDAPTVRPERMLTVDDLYPDLDPKDSILASALVLLDEAETTLVEAVALASEGDQISADDAVQRFQALLPELFCCRSLGDSFATVINALFHGLKNLNGLPATETQIAQMLNSTRVLRKRPFLVYTEALAVVARLEATKLRVDPRGLTTIQEILLG
jgi:hypothetical protein